MTQNEYSPQTPAPGDTRQHCEHECVCKFVEAWGAQICDSPNYPKCLSDTRSRPVAASQPAHKFDSTIYLIGETEIDRGVVELKNLLAMGNLCQDQKDCIEALRVILRDASNRPASQPAPEPHDITNANVPGILKQALADRDAAIRNEVLDDIALKIQQTYVGKYDNESGEIPEIPIDELAEIIQSLSTPGTTTPEPKFNSTDLILLAHDEWKRREERKHNHPEGSWCQGFINGFLTDKKWARKLIDKMYADAAQRTGTTADKGGE